MSIVRDVIRRNPTYTQQCRLAAKCNHARMSFTTQSPRPNPMAVPRLLDGGGDE